jgi:hypothetical protein
VFENLYGLGSGSRPSQFEKSKPDQDPDKNRPDPQHWIRTKYEFYFTRPGEEEVSKNRTGTLSDAGDKMIKIHQF